MTAHTLECSCRQCLLDDVARAEKGARLQDDLAIARLGAIAAALLCERALVGVLATTGEQA